MAMRTVLPAIFVFLLFLTIAGQAIRAETVARCGDGWLERIDGYLVLHLKGTHYEMGYQHGALLRDHVRQNLHNLLEVRGDEVLAEIGPLAIKPRQLIETIVKVQRPYVPQKYLDEIRGLADGAEIKFEDARVCNFIPEMFHCSGFAVMNSATKDGMLYHGRVLDYAIDWGLQEHAVVIVGQPVGGIPFVNVSYAGFVGSVTGMNQRQVSIGEMGGGGLGHWEGVPMAFLVREVLETAGDLDEAISVFRDNRRTCQYFYVIADAKTNRAVGMEASWNRFELIRPGQQHSLLPDPITDTVLLSAGDRYRELVRRVKSRHGEIDAETAIRLMDRPVAMRSNLHNVLFEPKTTRFWVANASIDKKPAATQKYFAFQLTELLARRPSNDCRRIPAAAARQ